ncbi:hypothetical protein [Pseudoalteromonas gelatinilytica]|uniref:Uncharacterized protein n=1 Tax=Pseudoalteromonas gelatinilytica TaxID=1703256 RepID=A0A3A3ENY4_9GAMM|nr:hypothetical protein [Pseudoalteromonas profundi]RJF35426.1 hypothetical protein D4741_10635 [Pseudoalteromonas profundi]
MSYQWKKDLCCIGTYKTLSDNSKLDQFEEEDISFESAPDVKMKQLRYFLHTTTTQQAIEHLALQMAMSFLNNFSENYVLTKQKKELQTADFYRDLASIFKDGDKNIKELAELMDKYVQFEDE